MAEINSRNIFLYNKLKWYYLDMEYKYRKVLAVSFLIFFSAIIPLSAATAETASALPVTEVTDASLPGEVVKDGTILGTDIHAVFYEKYAEISAGTVEETMAFIADFAVAFDIPTEGVQYLILNNGTCRVPYLGLTINEAIAFFDGALDA